MVCEKTGSCAKIVDAWAAFLGHGIDEIEAKRLERHLGSGEAAADGGVRPGPGEAARA